VIQRLLSALHKAFREIDEVEEKKAELSLVLHLLFLVAWEQTPQDIGNTKLQDIAFVYA